MLKRKLWITAVTLLAFSLISWGIIAAVGRKPLEKEENRIIVTSFYPVYILAENLLQDVDGQMLVNLTENHTGCVHDYQLTTKDMLTLESADLLLINGGDMELFVTEALKGLSDLPVIDSCEGIELLVSEGHHHHGESETVEDEHDHEADEHDDHEETEEHDEHEDHDDEELSPNGHVWLDINRYLTQLQTISAGLAEEMPESAQQIKENQIRYQEEIVAFQEEYEQALAFLNGTEVIIFHDAFYYLCEELGMEVVHGENLDEDTALSAGEIAEIADEIRLHGIRYLLAEEATGAVAEQLAKETGCEVIYLDPITSGEAASGAYLAAMRANLERLQQLQP